MNEKQAKVQVNCLLSLWFRDFLPSAPGVDFLSKSSILLKKRRWGRQLEIRDDFSLTCNCLSSDYFFLQQQNP